MHPVLINIKDFLFIHDFFIGTYGVFVALGLLVGILVSDRMARRNGIDPNLIMDIAFIGVIAGIIGARLNYILVNFGDFVDSFADPRHSPMEYVFSRQGFVFGGGMILATLACIYYIKRKQERLWKVADVIAPAIPLGHGLGRIGCFFAGCCWGGRCDLPWAVEFPKVIGPQGEALGFVYEDHLDQGLITAADTHSLPVHPVQLYEAFSLFILSAILFWAWRKRRFEGQIFLIYLLAYPIIRFVDEYFRGDTERGIYGWFSTSQYLSMGVFVAGIVLCVALRNRPIPVQASIEEPVATPEPATAETPHASKRRRKH